MNNNNLFNSIISSGVASISQVLIGMPFDSIKSRIQSGYRKNLFKHLYRGFQYPLLTSLAINVSTFPIYEATLPYTHNSFLSGAIGGFVASPLIYEIDKRKLFIQVHKNNNTGDTYKLKRFRGLGSTFVRETIAMGISFYIYDKFKDKYSAIVAGSLAGLCNWTTTYGIDTIKSRQICNNITILEAIKLGELYSGFSYAAVRAVLVNGAIYGSYNLCQSLLHKKKN